MNTNASYFPSLEASARSGARGFFFPHCRVSLAPQWKHFSSKHSPSTDTEEGIIQAHAGMEGRRTRLLCFLLLLAPSLESYLQTPDL